MFRNAWPLALLLLFACSPDSIQPPAAPPSGDEEFERLVGDFVGRPIELGPVTRDVAGARDARWDYDRRERGRGIFLNHYPLALGNRWDYRRVFAIRSVSDGEDPSWEVLRIRAEHELIGTEELFEREYIVREERLDEGELGLHTQWIRLRQDEDGLYEADVAVNHPPAKLERPASLQPSGRERLLARLLDEARGDQARSDALQQLRGKLEVLDALRSAPLPSGLSKEVQDDELQRLAYPIWWRSEWTVLENPNFTMQVVGLQPVWLPAGRFLAWRLRVESEVFGPDDHVVMWLGRVGFLGYAAKLHVDVTDLEGNVIGTSTIFERELLVDFELSQP